MDLQKAMRALFQLWGIGILEYPYLHIYKYFQFVKIADGQKLNLPIRELTRKIGRDHCQQ